MTKRLFGSLTAASLLTVGLFMTTAAQAQDTTEGSVEAPMPRTSAAPFRIMPVVGSSSFTTADEIDTDEFGDTLSAGVLADFGSGRWTFETGILTLQSDTNTTEDSAAIDIDTWGVPLLAKVNFSGKPHETIFLKAGVMPFNAAGDADEFDVLGVAGVGGAIPLGRNSSLLLDASYNRRIGDDGVLGDYQGISLLGGLSFNL